MGAAVSVAMFVALLVAFWVPRTPSIGPDTLVLENGAKTALHCLRSGQLSNCGRSPEDRAQAPYSLISAVGPFVILQYPVAVGLLELGLSDHQVYRALSLLSIVAFLGTLLLFSLVPFRLGRAEWAPILVLVFLSGPFLHYGYATWGEMLGAFFLVAFVAAAVRPSHWLVIASTAWLAGLTKETAAPFVIALGVVALLVAGQTVRSARGRLVGLVLGASLALVTNALFNVFRYGTVTNQEYLHGYGGHIPAVPLGQRVINFIGLLGAPNGGIALFWPSAFVLLVAGCVYGMTAAGEGRRNRLGGVGVALTFVALTAGLASWFAPFGWFAWGPRLMLPWLPPFVLLVAMLYGDRLLPAVKWLTRSTRSTITTSIAITVAALPQIGVLAAPSVAYELFQPDRSCPNPTHPAGHGCHNYWAWSKHPVLLDALHGFRSHWGLLLGATFSLAALSCLMLARVQSRLPQVDVPRGLDEVKAVRWVPGRRDAG